MPCVDLNSTALHGMRCVVNLIYVAIIYPSIFTRFIAPKAYWPSHQARASIHQQDSVLLV